MRNPTEQSLAHQLFDTAFDVPRQPRSKEYKEGVLYILRLKTGEITKAPCPYSVETAQADAWFSGCQEGHTRWREAEAVAGRMGTEQHIPGRRKVGKPAVGVRSMHPNHIYFVDASICAQWDLNGMRTPMTPNSLQSNR